METDSVLQLHPGLSLQRSEYEDVKQDSPYPVWDTSSAAPPMGLVKTPTMPFPTPEMTPLALVPAELWDSQFLWKFCIGWSTIPAMAPESNTKTSSTVTPNPAWFMKEQLSLCSTEKKTSKNAS